MRTRYPPEFRDQIVELVQAGRSPQALAREFEPSEQTIRNWVKQADLESGRRTDGLTMEERGELRRLRRENRQLTLEREILKKAAAWFARQTKAIPESDRRHNARADHGDPSRLHPTRTTPSPPVTS